MIIILSQECRLTQNRLDPHVASVTRYFKKVGQDYLIFKRHHPKHFLSFQPQTSLDKPPRLTLQLDGALYEFKSKNSFTLWNRSKSYLDAEKNGQVGTVDQKFRMLQWRQVINALESSSLCKGAVNTSLANYHMDLKINQLNMAVGCGLTIPNTVISNDPDEILNLFNHCNQVIYKAFTPLVNEKGTLYATIISASQIEHARDSVGVAPGIYQEYIQKAYELRVYVIGDQVIVVKIDSQQQALTKHDWRRGQSLPIFTKGALSPTVERQLLNFHQQSGLAYAAYDFIVTLQGQEIFLECNPGGQWLFVGNVLGEKISEALASYLIEQDVTEISASSKKRAVVKLCQHFN